MLLGIKDCEPFVTKRIEELLDKEIHASQKFGNFLPEHITYFKKLSTVNGKRVRAYLIYLGSQLFASNEEAVMSKDVLDLAAAVEIFHTAILIHDDIEDQGTIRRGIDTYHIFEQKKYNSKHIGESLAIDIGDAGYFFAVDIIANISSMPVTDRLRTMKMFARVAINLSYGQAFDIISTITHSSDISFERLLDICNLKTGTYTFLLPLKMGMVSSGNFRYADTINDYAYHSGIVFQLTDDILDIFADPETTGKVSCGDLREGKINGIIKKTLEMADKGDKAYITSILTQEEKDIDTERVREIIKRCGALDTLHEYINSHTQSAIQSLEGIEGQEMVKKNLKKLVLSLHGRNS